MDCMDTCNPSAQARASTVATADSIAFIAIVILLVAGLAVPSLRRGIAPAFSAAIGLAALR
jgi:hypothetical protein